VFALPTIGGVRDRLASGVREEKRLASNRVDELLGEAAASRRPLERARTLPPGAFNDSDWFDAERGRVFDASWIAVGRSDEVAEPNQFLSASVAGEPVVVVRGRDGELRALSNVCPHRNMTIVEGSGSAPSLLCKYHLWSFRHDGQLLNAPHMEAAEDFDAATVCLPRLAVEEWHGWVFVNVDSTSEPLAGSMPELDAYLTEQRVADVVHVGSLDYPHDWNWKITVENFIESYHHRGVHPDTLDATYPGAQSIPIMAGDEAWSGLDHVSVVEGEEPFLVFVMYPALTFAITRGVAMLWFRLSPTSAGRTEMTIEVYVQPEFVDSPEIAELLMAGVAEINEEDIGVNRRTAEGLRSRFAKPGPVSHLEGANWHFRRWLLDRMDAT